MFRQVLSRRGDKPPREHLNERCRQFARERGVPEAVIEMLDGFAYAGSIRIGPVALSRLSELDLENGEEANAPGLEHGFLIVGCGLNGDPVALELASGKMAFLAHDLLWEQDYDHFEECVVRTPLDFEEFWVQAAESADFPRDSYDARKRWPSSGDDAIA